ncbi:MAG TPA: hypothetical protein PKL14_10705 [Holophaga sp.]|nr:hypothetical protein [Holophaga sp.]
MSPVLSRLLILLVAAACLSVLVVTQAQASPKTELHSFRIASRAVPSNPVVSTPVPAKELR